ncbi:MAG: MATE family efflux transporter [Candidatus Kuenenia sp.]|nr:MATE family efflux transporter [Candidatus Kuenenia hertensis]
MLELTEKNLNKNILKLCIPVAIENLLHMSVFVSDTIMVGRLGTDAIAAAGLAGSIFFFISLVISSLSYGASSIVARHIGAKEKDHAQLVSSQAILIALFMGMLISPFLIIFARTIFILMSAEPNVADIGKGYFQIISGFLIFRLIIFVSSGILRGAGDTKTPMKVTIIINCVNIFLNWIFIFGIGPFPQLGVTGVGWATAISFLIGAGLLLSKLFRGKCILHLQFCNIRRLHFTSIRRIIRISIPATIDAFLTQIGFLFFTKIVTMLGTVPLAAHQIAIRIESMSFMPGFALAVSTATLVGQSLGTKNVPLALKSMKRSCLFSICFMSFFAFIFIVFPARMATIFHPAPDVLSLAAVCIMIAAIEQPALAVYMVFSGGLRGAGDTLSPMLITIIGTLCLHLPMAYLFGIKFGWGLWGVWLGAAIDWICRAIAIFILYKKGRWKTIIV